MLLDDAVVVEAEEVVPTAVVQHLERALAELGDGLFALRNEHVLVHFVDPLQEKYLFFDVLTNF